MGISEEYLLSVNADQEPFLKAILATQATSMEALLGVADSLESVGEFQTCYFGQLPLQLAIGDQFQTNMEVGRSAAAHVTLAPIFAKVSACNVELFAEPGTERTYCATQITCMVEVWGRHSRYYRNYASMLGHGGLTNKALNRASFKTRGAYSGADASVMAGHFEQDLCKAIVLTSRFAVREILQSYRLLTLDDIDYRCAPVAEFVMTAPGRITYSTKPVSVINQLFSERNLPSPPSIEHMATAMKFTRREEDAFIRRLVNLSTLFRSGESDLAVMGCVAAVEWLLNDIIGNDGNKSHSVRECAKLEPIRSWPEKLRSKLFQMQDVRNAAVHRAAPPDSKVRSNQRFDLADDALDIYRYIRGSMRAKPRTSAV